MVQHNRYKNLPVKVGDAEAVIGLANTEVKVTQYKINMVEMTVV